MSAKQRRLSRSNRVGALQNPSTYVLRLFSKGTLNLDVLPRPLPPLRAFPKLKSAEAPTGRLWGPPPTGPFPERFGAAASNPPTALRAGASRGSVGGAGPGPLLWFRRDEGPRLPTRGTRRELARAGRGRGRLVTGHTLRYPLPLPFMKGPTFTRPPTRRPGRPRSARRRRRDATGSEGARLSSTPPPRFSAGRYGPGPGPGGGEGASSRRPRAPAEPRARRVSAAAGPSVRHHRRPGQSCALLTRRAARRRVARSPATRPGTRHLRFRLLCAH